MNRFLRRIHRGQRGVTLIELLVALAVFALFILMIDAVFSSARTNSRKTELAADVQQNARVAVDRLTRELREARSRTDLYLCPTLDACMVVDTNRILFKSARLVGTPTVFCLYVRTRTDTRWNETCFDSFLSANRVPKPSSSAPYTYPSGPPYPLCAPNTDTTKLAPCGSYQPIWQQYVGYFVVENPPGSGLFELHRVSGQLDSPLQSLSVTLLTGGDVVATMVESFVVSPPSASGVISVTLQAKGSEVVQGRAIPDQQIELPGKSLSRD